MTAPRVSLQARFGQGSLWGVNSPVEIAVGKRLEVRVAILWTLKSGHLVITDRESNPGCELGKHV